MNAYGNNNSQTTTVNIQKNTKVFRDAEAAIKNGLINDSEKELILSKLKDFELAVDSQTKTKRYHELIASAANHITILAPFIPAFSEFMK